MQRDKETTLQTLTKLTTDESSYKKVLGFEKDGSKSNPVQIKDCPATTPEAIGIHLIQLSLNWKPKPGEDNNIKIGNLYGFDCVIRRQKETYENNSMFEYRYQNTFYAESKATGIKYTWNQGHLNNDNPKLAARHFLNCIDRVENLKDKYEKNLKELERNIPMLEQLVAKPFEKENELAQFKADVTKLEREITIKIQKNQLAKETNVPEKETPVIKMEKTLLPKKDVAERKTKGLKI
jgi:predicted metal-dependent hydrolase